MAFSLSSASWWMAAVMVMMMMISSSDAFGGVSPSSPLAHVSSSFHTRNSMVNPSKQHQHNKIITTSTTNGKEKSALFLGRRMEDGRGGGAGWWRKRRHLNSVKLTQRFQKLWKLVGMMAIVWNFSTFHASVPNVAHAATTTRTSMTMVSRGGSSSKVEQRLVDKYVRNYMFHDDVYDPVESTYRETIADSSSSEDAATSSSHSKQLSDTVSQVLGKSVAATTLEGSGSGSANQKAAASSTGLLKTMTNLVNFLTGQLKLPSGLAYLIVTAVVFGTPTFALAIFGLMFSRAQRSMTDKMASDRYGADNIDLDATERIEDDSDDDDDDRDNNDDDNDDDDSYDSEDESDDE